MPAVVQSLSEDEIAREIVEPLAPRAEEPTDLRQALQATAEDAYTEIELGLRADERAEIERLRAAVEPTQAA
jgi:hypothetical protein